MDTDSNSFLPLSLRHLVDPCHLEYQDHLLDQVGQRDQPDLLHPIERKLYERKTKHLSIDQTPVKTPEVEIDAETRFLNS